LWPGSELTSRIARWMEVSSPVASTLRVLRALAGGRITGRRPVAVRSAGDCGSDGALVRFCQRAARHPRGFLLGSLALGRLALDNLLLRRLLRGFLLRGLVLAGRLRFRRRGGIRIHEHVLPGGGDRQLPGGGVLAVRGQFHLAGGRRFLQGPALPPGHRLFEPLGPSTGAFAFPSTPPLPHGGRRWFRAHAITSRVPWWNVDGSR